MRIVLDNGFLCFYAEPWCYGCQVFYSRDNTADFSHEGEVGQSAWIALDDMQEWVDYVFMAVKENLTLDGGWSPCRSLVVNWPSAAVTSYYKAEPGARDLAILPTFVTLYDADMLNRQATHMQTMHSLFMRLCKRRNNFKRMSWKRQKGREFLDFLKSEEVQWCKTWKKCKSWKLFIAEMKLLIADMT